VSPYLIVVIGIVVAASAFFRLRSPPSASVKAAAFTPNPSNDTEVFYTGCDEAELAKVLAAFAHVYKEALGASGEFRTAKLGEEKFRITFPQDISPDSLSFLVNYLQYPEDVDLSTHELAVLGRVTLTADFPLPREDYIGQRARIYVPANDRQYDLVYIALGTESFEQTFRQMHWKQVDDGRIPEGVKELW
jgi:hypothetical protein